MSVKLGIVMDPIADINLKKDSSFAMLLEAQARGYELYYLEMADLFLDNGRAFGNAAKLTVRNQAGDHFSLEPQAVMALSDLDVILMRKDPPFDTEFVYATYMLERAEDEGCLIVNKPQSLRDANEKLYTSWFADFIPNTLVTRDANRIREFYTKHNDIILKPLDGMGGASIFRVKPGDPNLGVIIETLTAHGSRYAMAQAFIPDITDGDKRPDVSRDLVKIAVVERHGKNGNIATGFVQGFGLQRGAIASTVCHDHHNIACVGVDYDDMALAANRLGEIEGGFVVVEGGKVLAEVALPVAGLMSLEPFEVVRDALVDLRAAAKGLGVTLEEPFLQLAFLALPVIPALKITDRGMVDVEKFEIIS
mgnify:CR=1 FL=1